MSNIYIIRSAPDNDHIEFSMQLHPCAKFYYNKLMESGRNFLIFFYSSGFIS